MDIAAYSFIEITDSINCIFVFFHQIYIYSEAFVIGPEWIKTACSTRGLVAQFMAVDYVYSISKNIL